MNGFFTDTLCSGSLKLFSAGEYRNNVNAEWRDHLNSEKQTKSLEKRSRRLQDHPIAGAAMQPQLETSVTVGSSPVSAEQ